MILTLAALMYALAVFVLRADGGGDALIACYPLDGTLKERDGRAAAALLYCYDQGTVEAKPSNFLTDPGENGVFNVRCLSLAGAGDRPFGEPRADYAGRFAARVPAGLLPRGGTEFTLSLWYKSEGISQGGKDVCGARLWETGAKLMAFGNAMNSLIFHVSANGQPAGLVTCNGAVIARADRSFCSDQWLHLCFVVKDKTMRIYLDGRAADAAEPVAAPRDLISIVNQGGYLGDGDFLEGVHANGGWYADVRLYGKALDAPQIRALWDGGRSGLLLSSADSRYAFDRPASYDLCEYAVTVDAATDMLRIRAQRADPAGTLIVSRGSCDKTTDTVMLPLLAGDNRFVLSLISSNGRRAEYTISVFRPDGAGGQAPSSADCSSRPALGLSSQAASLGGGLTPDKGAPSLNFWTSSSVAVSQGGGEPESQTQTDDSPDRASSQRVLSSRISASGELLAALAVPAPLAMWGGFWLVKRTKQRRKRGGGGALPPWIR